METLTQSELVMKRMVCGNCKEGTFEFGDCFFIGKYICGDCSEKFANEWAEKTIISFF